MTTDHHFYVRKALKYASAIKDNPPFDMYLLGFYSGKIHIFPLHDN